MLRVIEGWTVPWIGMQRNCYCLNLCCRGITSRWWMRVITKLLESWHGSRFMNWGDVEWSELEWVEAQIDNISQNQFGFSYEMFTFLVFCRVKSLLILSDGCLLLILQDTSVFGLVWACVSLCALAVVAVAVAGCPRDAVFSLAIYVFSSLRRGRAG